MPPIRRDSGSGSGSGLDYVGKGFWFAIGFTPVFILLTSLATLVYVNISAQMAQAALNDLMSQTHQAIPAQSPSPRRFGTIQPSHRTSEQEQERECSVLMLRYSETQDPADKAKMLNACPQ